MAEAGRLGGASAASYNQEEEPSSLIERPRLRAEQARGL
jgi:hypothetical protein